MTKKRYRCLGCDKIFNAEEPPSTIPTSVVYCPLCGGLAERFEVWAEILNKKPEKGQNVRLNYGARDIDKWLKNDVIPSLKDLEGKAEKLDTIEALMREQPYVDMNRMNQYSVKPLLDHRGTKLVESIMAILFPDEPESS